MNQNLSSNMMSTTGGQQMSSPFVSSSQSMAPNLQQNPAIGQQMDGAITSTSGAMTGQSGGGQQQVQQMSGQTGQQSTNMANMNIAYVCRVGHETVQEIVTKTAELFGSLRLMCPQNSQQPIMPLERQLRTKDMLKSIEFLFKRLRKSYEKCNECLSSIDYIQIESIIPMKDEDYHKVDDKKSSNIKVKQLDKEHKDLEDLLLLKNRQIKEIIDNLRAIVWEINTMLAMRKP